MELRHLAHHIAGRRRSAIGNRQSERFHTYYGDAWVALGRILLGTPWLSQCGPGIGAA
jgi:hypothetical protein